MSLQELIDQVKEFDGWNHTEKAKFFGWFLHKHRSIDVFMPKQIEQCFSEVHLPTPANVRRLLDALSEKKPPEVVRGGTGFKLALQTRRVFDSAYGERKQAQVVSKILEDLPGRVPNLEEQGFLREAIICFKNEAFRAAVVMTWNLTFHHLLTYVISDSARLSAFNTAWLNRYPNHHVKKGVKSITRIEDFSEDLRESETLEILKSARLITSDLFRVLETKLGFRNSAAHPSSLVIEYPQAEEYIHSLVNNVVLKLDEPNKTSLS